MYLAAVDGITLPALDTVTAENPALLAPRIDSPLVLAEGEYLMFKNYNLPTTGLTIKDKKGKVIYRSMTRILISAVVVNSKNNHICLRIQEQ